MFKNNLKLHEEVSNWGIFNIIWLRLIWSSLAYSIKKFRTLEPATAATTAATTTTPRTYFTLGTKRTPYLFAPYHSGARFYSVGLIQLFLKACNQHKVVNNFEIYWPNKIKLIDSKCSLDSYFLIEVEIDFKRIFNDFFRKIKILNFRQESTF